MDGTIHDIRWFDRVLTDAEVLTLSTGGVVHG